MPVPTTNITLSSIQTEYGGANPIAVGEYIRGGLYVPSGQTSAFGTIPSTTSNIPMGVFRGTTKVASTLDTFTLTAGVGSIEVVKGDPIVTNGYLSSSYPNFGGGVSPAGSLNDYTFAPTNSFIIALAVMSGLGPPALEFWVNGEHPNSGWTTMTVYHNYTGTTTVLNRADFTHASNPASGGNQAYTYWIKSNSNIFSNTTSGQNTYLITVT